MKAWLITWEWTNESTAVTDRVVGILDPRLSPKTVARLVEFLYAQATSSLTELADYARAPKSNSYRSQLDNHERIDCGHNPSLHAELVEDLSVERETDVGIETIKWRTHPTYAHSGSEVQIVAEGHDESFTRTIHGPVSNVKVRSARR